MQKLTTCIYSSIDPSKDAILNDFASNKIKKNACDLTERFIKSFVNYENNLIQNFRQSNSLLQASVVQLQSQTLSYSKLDVIHQVISNYLFSINQTEQLTKVHQKTIQALSSEKITHWLTSQFKLIDGLKHEIKQEIPELVEMDKNDESSDTELEDSPSKSKRKSLEDSNAIKKIKVEAEVIQDHLQETSQPFISSSSSKEDIQKAFHENLKQTEASLRARIHQLQASHQQFQNDFLSNRSVNFNKWIKILLKMYTQQMLLTSHQELLEKTAEQKIHIKGIEQEPQNYFHYLKLAQTLSSDEKILLLNGSYLTQQELLLKAFECNSDHASVCFYLAKSIKEQIIKTPTGKNLTKQDLYLRAIYNQTDYTEAYYCLATTIAANENLIVQDLKLSRKSLLIKALSLDSKHAKAYHDLSLILKPNEYVEINKQRFHQKELLLQAIDLDPCFAEAYYHLANMLPFQGNIQLLNGQSITQQELFKKALDLNPHSAEMHVALGKTIKIGDSITCLKGEKLSQEQLFLKAIDLNPNYLNAYHKLGAVLKQNEIMLLNGKVMTKKELLEKK